MSCANASARREDTERIYAAQVAKDETTIKWAMARVNQLEGERAALLGRVTGMVMPYPEVSVEAPSIQQKSRPPESLP